MTDGGGAVVAAVRRWESAGGHWRVVTRSATTVVIGLFSCDGGEEMQRLTASHGALEALLEGSGGCDG